MIGQSSWHCLITLGLLLSPSNASGDAGFVVEGDQRISDLALKVSALEARTKSSDAIIASLEACSGSLANALARFDALSQSSDNTIAHLVTRLDEQRALITRLEANIEKLTGGQNSEPVPISSSDIRSSNFGERELSVASGCPELTFVTAAEVEAPAVSTCSLEVDGIDVSSALTQLQNQVSNESWAVYQSGAYTIAAGTPLEIGTVLERPVMPVGFLAHPASSHFPQLRGTIFELDAPTTMNITKDGEVGYRDISSLRRDASIVHGYNNPAAAGSRYAYGHALYTTTNNGPAGHWGIFKTFRIQQSGGTLNTRAFFWSSSCGLPRQATFTDFSTESWFCEDEGDLRYEFFDANGATIDVSAEMAYSKTWSHQQGEPWTEMSPGVYTPSLNGTNYDKILNADRTDIDEWLPFTHTAIVPSSSSHVRITMYGTDGTNKVKPLGYNGANAGGMFSRLEVGYSLGLAEVTGTVLCGGVMC